MSYLTKNLGLTTWSQTTPTNLHLAKGSLFATNNFSGIELLHFNPLSPKTQITPIAKFEIGIPVNCLKWEQTLPSCEKGVITAGLSDGSLILLDAKTLISDFSQNRDSGENAILTSFELYENQNFFCMEYNLFRKGLLATGGNELYVVNFEKDLENPVIFSPLEDSEEERVFTSLSWNKSKAVQHILASARDDGKIDIFDLKMKKSIFSFSDGKEGFGGREVNLAWNSKIPTQIAVAFDCEKSGVQIWDLRSSKAPVKVLDGFGRVHSIDWSLESSRILCGNKNGEFFVYDYDKDVAVEYKEEGFDILYAKFAPGMDSTFFGVSEKGDLVIKTEDEGYLQELSMQNIPFWLEQSEKSYGIDSGSGFTLAKKNGKIEVNSYEILKSEKTTNTEFEQVIERFNENIEKSQTNPITYANYLKKNSNHETSILDLIINLDENPEKKLESLNIHLDTLIKNTEKITGFAYNQNPKKTENPQNDQKLTKQFADITDNEACNFFSTLAKEQETKTKNSQNTNTPKNPLKTLNVGGFQNPEKSDITTISFEKNTNWKKGLESFIKKNIVINNYEGALDCAIKANRIFEAFMIAYSHPDKRDYYMEYLVEKFSLLYSDEFLRTFLKPLSMKKYGDIIDGYDVREWKDILTFIVKNVSDEKEKKKFYGQLARRVEESDQDQAILNFIYLFSGENGKFVKKIEENIKNCTTQEEILKNFEILYLFSLKTGITLEDDLFNYLFRVCNVLVDENYLKLAYELMSRLGDDKKERVLVYLNRLYMSFESVLGESFEKPKELRVSYFKFPERKTNKIFSGKKKIGSRKGNVNPFGSRNKFSRPNKNVNTFPNKHNIFAPPRSVNSSRNVLPPKTLAPPRSVLPPKTLAPPRSVLPPKTLAPPRSVLPPKTVAPPRSVLPPKTLAPPRSVLPPKTLAPPRSVLPPKTLAPPRSVLPPKTLAPPRSVLPPKTLAPPRSVLPPKTVAPPRSVLPPKTLAPPRNVLPPKKNIKSASSQLPPKRVAPPLKTKNAPKPPKNIYSHSKVNEINDFISKTPDFIKDIAESEYQEKQMNESLEFLVRSIGEGSVGKDLFESVFEIVHCITENDVNRASFMVGEAIPRNSGEFGMVLSTLKFFIDALV